MALTTVTFCNVVNAFGSGLLLFPRSQHSHLGISMVMMSTAASQLVFAVLLCHGLKMFEAISEETENLCSMILYRCSL